MITAARPSARVRRSANCIALWSFSVRALYRRALELLERMPRRALKPDAISYSAAMSACDAGCKWQRTIEILERMLQCGLKPAESSYSSAIGACAAGAQLQRAQELLERMPPLTLDGHDPCSAAVGACEAGRQLHCALEFLCPGPLPEGT